MKKTHKFLSFILCLILVAFCAFALVGCSLNPETQIKNYTVDGDLKIGIISDSQLPPLVEDDDGKFKQNLINALSGLKANQVNMIIFAGDIGDKASNHAYTTYYDCYRAVYGADYKFNQLGEGESSFSVNNPLVQTIMGNHDYWGGYDGMWNKGSYRKKFEEKIGESPFTHYVVNGYHFIGASPDKGSPMEKQYNALTKWLDEEIAKAVKEDPSKPVFVTTHNSPRNTVYGSEDWGEVKLYDVFKKYPQVVNMSGHLHYSIMDERAMWQGDFTAFSTQSVSYTELEGGKANGTIPPDADMTPMGEIMEILQDKISIQRMNFGKKNENGEYGVEEKADKRWELPLPLTKENFVYTNEKRQQANTAPTMTEGNGSFKVDGEKTFLTFTAGSDDDFVHSYKIVWQSGKKFFETLYFTDFINGIADMKTEVTLQVYGVPKGTYDLKIYAIDSWGKVSEKFVTIGNVTVVKEIKYISKY